jgi:hypothetical protein
VIREWLKAKGFRWSHTVEELPSAQEHSSRSTRLRIGPYEAEVDVMSIPKAGFYEITVRSTWGMFEAHWQTYTHGDAFAAWRNWFKTNGLGVDKPFPDAEEIAEAFARDSQPPAYAEPMHEDLEERIVSPDDLRDLRNLVELPRAKA